MEKLSKALSVPGGVLKFDQRSQELQAMGPTADGSVPRGIAYQVWRGEAYLSHFKVPKWGDFQPE